MLAGIIIILLVVNMGVLLSAYVLMRDHIYLTEWVDGLGHLERLKYHHEYGDVMNVQIDYAKEKIAACKEKIEAHKVPCLSYIVVVLSIDGYVAYEFLTRFQVLHT